jgi:hypothetical protein
VDNQKVFGLGHCCQEKKIVKLLDSNDIVLQFHEIFSFYLESSDNSNSTCSNTNNSMSTGGDASAVVDNKNMLNEKSLELNAAFSRKKIMSKYAVLKLERKRK